MLMDRTHKFHFVGAYKIRLNGRSKMFKYSGQWMGTKEKDVLSDSNGLASNLIVGAVMPGPTTTGRGALFMICDFGGYSRCTPIATVQWSRNLSQLTCSSGTDRSRARVPSER